MRTWIEKVMRGRYGTDQLSSALLYLSFLFYIVSLPIKSNLLKVCALICLLIGYYRVFSKQINKRQQENFKFIRLYTPLTKRLHTRMRQLKEFKTYKYFRCPNCKQTLRVPRQKGNVSVTCPKCQHTFHAHV